MGAQCSIDKKRLEYQTLKRMSGISDFDLDTFVYNYLKKNNRYPELDEIPRANSSEFLRDQLQIKDSQNFSYTDTQNVLDYTNTETIEEAIPIINNKFRDLEVDVIQIEDSSIINIKRRPSKYNIIEPPTNEVDTDFNSIKSRAVMSNIIGKLNHFYGTKFVYGTSQDLAKIVPNASVSKAFVHDGIIYVNTDLATIDSPIHELLHIFLGSMRYTDPDFYFNLVTQARSFPSFDYRASFYKNRTELDLCEEIFVEEFAKLLTNQTNDLTNLSSSDMSKLIYNINRTLDSALMGKYSVQSCKSGNTLLQLAELTKSEIMNGSVIGKIGRQVSNLKSKLLENGDLREECL